ncbi:achaete-scute homolog 1b-like [Artemia franciscana]|uniref:BHLH domain-containing protein n=1 Tax=Artemia franciscana TaxID=6661 RepID=A0AA88IDB0_ARTSF|nr:hypothetical protein QYM36_000479 [Artemia franciscana]
MATTVGYSISHLQSQQSYSSVQSPRSSPEKPSVMNQLPESGSNCKRRIQFSSLGYVLPSGPGASVVRRNARERNRVKQVNQGFAILRQQIPASIANSRCENGSKRPGRSRKISKVETLRCAVEYIRALEQILRDDGDFETKSTESQSSYNLSPDYTCDPSSPAPSYSSDASSQRTGSLWEMHSNEEKMKTEIYNPSDDELLDAITWWQQSQ